MSETTTFNTLLDELKQGNYLVVDLVSTNAINYTLPFIIAQIDVDVSSLNTTDPTNVKKGHPAYPGAFS